MTRPFSIVQSARTAALCLAVPGARYHLPQPLTWRLLPLGHAGPERRGTARSVVTLLDGLEPGQRFRFAAEGLEPFDFETQPCSGLMDAANFGVAGDTPLDDMDAARNNAAALSKAVVATPEGGTLQLGPGTWTSFPVRLKSRMTLRLAQGAVLRAPSGRFGWPILPAHDHAGGMLGSWEGLPSACFAAPLHAVEAEHLTIEGQGTLDGSADQADWWSWPKETRDGARRPRGLHLVSCRDVKLLGFTIRNAASWTIHPQGCDRLTAAGLTIIAPHDSPNTDGFNPESCRKVTIAGVHFSVGDDCIAVKAGKRGADGAAEHLSETRGVHISHCLMERGHGGLVVGSEMSGGVHDVTVEDCEMIATDRGLRLKTRRGRGGSITNIVMRRVLMNGVQTGLSANAHYHCDADGHDDWVQSRTVAPVDAGTPDIDGIVVEDVEMRGLAHAAGVFLGLPEAPIRNIRIRRLTIVSLDPDAVATAPIMADRIRPMRHEMILAEQAEIDCDEPALLSSSFVSLLSA